MLIQDFTGTVKGIQHINIKIGREKLKYENRGEIK